MHPTTPYAGQDAFTNLLLAAAALPGLVVGTLPHVPEEQLPAGLLRDLALLDDGHRAHRARSEPEPGRADGRRLDLALGEGVRVARDERRRRDAHRRRRQRRRRGRPEQRRDVVEDGERHYGEHPGRGLMQGLVFRGRTGEV